MNELLDMLLERLPKSPMIRAASGKPGCWSDGDMILCPTEASCENVADFLQDIFQVSGLAVHTGYYDPIEDRRNRECDDYTGFYYISFE